LPQISYCSFTKVPARRWVAGANAWRASCSFTSGRFRIATTSPFSRWTISGGSRAGPNIPAQGTIGNFDMPASVIDGTSGSSGLRLSSVVTSARSLPSRMWGATVEYELIIMCTCPLRRSVTAGGSVL
jgi:hypothetical protein